MDSFSRQAPGWDIERRLRRAEVVADQILKSVGRPDGNGRAMEFGCGTGLVSFCLKDHFGHITLVDSSPGMIAELARKLKAGGFSHMEPVCRDLTAQPWEGKAFHCVYSSMVLHHIRDVNGILAQLYDGILPGGRICIVDLDQEGGAFHREEKGFDGYNGFSHLFIADALEKAGFRDISAETFYHSEKQIGGEMVPYSLFCAAGERPE